ncbi:hypothetical protein HDU87_003214 [Geranomyces variabilis]|uniref:Uncharacterized protein n=1 Tax=Geranomyces variabilis TaxID=109894 RepID=A0AAD5TLT0_9FUNG|nr:hypothetical protein HDU87_003214 [Geranomyces variabilis]
MKQRDRDAREAMTSKDWQNRHMDSLEDLLENNKTNVALRDVVKWLKPFKPKPTPQEITPASTVEPQPLALTVQKHWVSPSGA